MFVLYRIANEKINAMPLNLTPITVPCFNRTVPSGYCACTKNTAHDMNKYVIVLLLMVTSIIWYCQKIVEARDKNHLEMVVSKSFARNRIEHTGYFSSAHFNRRPLLFNTKTHFKMVLFQIVYHIDIVAGIELSSKLIRLWNEVHFRSTTKTSLAQQNNAISLSDTKAKHFPWPHTHNIHSRCIHE